MSKELEALANMRADIIDFRDVIEGSSYSTDEDYENVKKALERNEKIKVNNCVRFDETYYEVERPGYIAGRAYEKTVIGGCCPICENAMNNRHAFELPRFCPYCGQRLDWSEEKI